MQYDFMETSESNHLLSQKISQKTKALVVTGFHRSATSALANYLQDAGLDMGNNLMKGAISNAKGHFEDIPVVKLHEQQLQNAQVNWQFHDQVALTPETDFLNDYIITRCKQNEQWGVKDPRACLFLPEWQAALGEHGNFLFVARHWSGCIESLLHRHSKEFAHNLTDITPDTTGAQFWQQPELAAKMWLSYNKRLLNFAQENPAQVILITQRALFEGAPVIATLNNKFGFTLDEDIQSPFEAELFRDTANKRIFEYLSTSLQQQLNSVWQELTTLADFRETLQNSQLSLVKAISLL